jgi:hypothetical protein
VRGVHGGDGVAEFAAPRSAVGIGRRHRRCLRCLLVGVCVFVICRERRIFFFFFCMNLQILCVEEELKKRFRCCFFGLVSKTHSRFTGAVP